MQQESLYLGDVHHSRCASGGTASGKDEWPRCIPVVSPHLRRGDADIGGCQRDPHKVGSWGTEG